jgi:protein-L-isoaspartate(D-aspartate) O-methyltransferase
LSGYPRRLLLTGLAVLFLTAMNPAAGAGDTAADTHVDARHAMVRVIEAIARAAPVGEGRRPIARRVLDVMAVVPRHRFVPEDMRHQAYDNRPLPIGFGQTISQPYIVALMTDLLEVEPGHVVLEVGTGSGYQAAVLAELVRHVYTIEIVRLLAEIAAKRLADTGYANVSVKAGDGYAGWPVHAPFDRVVVTAAADHVPPPLIEQLRPRGRIVIPVGQRFPNQNLMLVEKDVVGGVTIRPLLPVGFVLLTGDH